MLLRIKNFLTFPACFEIPTIFSNLNLNCFEHFIMDITWNFEDLEKKRMKEETKRDHPFRTLANFDDFLPLPPSVDSLLLQSVGNLANFWPPPLRNADVLYYGWSQTTHIQAKKHFPSKYSHGSKWIAKWIAGRGNNVFFSIFFKIKSGVGIVFALMTRWR